jgi:hypothetical protein
VLVQVGSNNEIYLPFVDYRPAGCMEAGMFCQLLH